LGQDQEELSFLLLQKERSSRSYGYELPENKGMKYVFDSMVIASVTKDQVEWIGIDILDLEELNGTRNPQQQVGCCCGF
jgi:hypothetical protein